MTYSATTSTSRAHQSYGRNQNTAIFTSARSHIGPVSHIIILVVIISTMGLIYLTQVTKTYSLGYKVDSLSKQQTELSEEHADLELESVKLQSIERVKESKVASNLSPVTPSAYAQ